MRLLLVTQYWPPEYGPDQSILFENMTYLRAHGVDVSVVAALPSYPTGMVPANYRGRLWIGEEIGGIPTIRTWTYSGDRTRLKHRIVNEVSFAITCLLTRGLLAGRFDLVLVLTPPQEVAISGWLLSRLFRSRYALYVMDLMPEVAVSLGMIRHPALIRMLRALARFTYRRCSIIIAASEAFKAGVEAYGIPSERVACVPNGVDTHFFRPVSPDPWLRDSLELGDRFVGIFAGTHGHSHDLDSMVRVAELLQSQGDDSISLVLVGDGSDKLRIQTAAAERRLRNIHFLDPVERDRVPALLASADAILVPFRRLSINTGVIPIKLYDGMACGKPVILAIEGEARRLLEEAQAGIALPPERPEQILEALRTLQRDPERARVYGENGRRYVEERYSRERCAALLLSALVRGAQA